MECCLTVKNKSQDLKGQKDFFACGQSHSAALTVHWTVIHYRSPSSPPTHAQNNKRAIAYATTLSLFWQGQKDLNPRPMVLETSTLPTELYPYVPIYYTKTFFICQGLSLKNINISYKKTALHAENCFFAHKAVFLSWRFMLILFKST